MKNLLNPKWLFAINTLPAAVLFFIFLRQFNIIKTLLDANSIHLWKIFSLALGVLGVLNFVYAVYLTFKKQNVSVFYGIAALLCYIPFIYTYGFYLNEIIPSSVPQWMISGNIFLYAGTFLMPTLAYAVFVLVLHCTPEKKEHKAWKNFLIAIAIPAAGYLFTRIVLPLWKWQYFEGEYFRHVVLVFIITVTLVFLFFLARGIFIIAAKKAAFWQKYQLVWKIPVAVLFPLLGLAVNNGLLFNKFGIYDFRIFGDFTGAWFYILAVVNGILICLPSLGNKIYRLCLFAGRSVTFAYTLYFFLVFLPFLPLSVFAVIAAGTGFLMLTPLLLFIVHVNELSKDFSFLKLHFSNKLLIGISVCGFLLIPAFITANYLKDKSVLTQTLNYLYTPDYSKQYSIDKKSLQKTFNVIKSHKENSRGFRGGIFGSRQPYLSAYFNWLVFDNLTLSDTKINFIERVFFAKPASETRPENIQNSNVEITGISTNSVFDKEQNVWRSWVNLEITNHNDNSWFAEYATTIELPEGAWISDYYLYVGDIKEYGILAEKRSAMWVFSNIRNENKDPGILYYLTGSKVAFRVFPFAKNEVRRTGIEFLHKEPVTLIIDNNIVKLGNAAEAVSTIVETERFAYISAEEKQKLKKVVRKPYYHFLVDVSEGKEELSADFVSRIEQFLKNNAEFAQNARISFVNAYTRTFPLDENWKQHYKPQTFEGGFYLERAVNTALFDAYKNKQYAVIVAVTDSIQNAILDKDFSDFSFAFPEGDIFFSLTGDGGLTPLPRPPAVNTVLEYPLPGGSAVYLPDNNQPSIILKQDIFKIDESEIQEKNWQSGLAMQAKFMSQTLHPETANKDWRKMLKYSFASRIMTPATSYLAVENEAQKAVLKQKQEQVLSGGKSLDLDDDTQRMSEPSLWILAILSWLVFYYRRIQKLKSKTSIRPKRHLLGAINYGKNKRYETAND